MTQKKIRVLMIGASGAIGKATVASLVKLQELATLTLLGRKHYDVFPADERIHQVIVDFDELDKAFAAHKERSAKHDVIICSLGTTKAEAKDNATYRRIEVDYPVAFARLSKEAGVSHAILVSSVGARASSWIRYLAQKGEVEDVFKSLGFDTLTILRPGLLGRGNDTRLGERLYALVQKPIVVEVVGEAIAHQVQTLCQLDGKPAVKILSNKDIYSQDRSP